jgi:alkylhydroperoxidase family enzyme
MSRIVSALRKRPAVLAEPEGDAGGTHDMLENGNFLRLLANSEAVIGAYQVWANALEGGKLNGRQRQLIALAVAEMNRSKYCLSAQFARGRVG